MPQNNVIELKRLREMHPKLPPDMARLMTVRAALGLQRNNHSSGVGLLLEIEDIELNCTLKWHLQDFGTIKQHDDKRIVEDGAEAIALAAIYDAKSWRVVRRLQQGENADWLLEQRDNVSRRLIAFEISGTDEGNVTSRMTEKLKQVSKCADVHQRWAGVVGFKKPQAQLQSTQENSCGY